MRLDFIPNDDGYSVELQAAAVETHALLGGLPARRLDLLGETYRVSVSYTLTPQSLPRFMEFLDAYNANPGWFDCLLVTDPVTSEHPLRNHKANIIPDTVSWDKLEGHRVTVSMELEAYMDELFPTTRHYPIEIVEGLDVLPPPFVRASDYAGVFTDSMQSNLPALLSGLLTESYTFYEIPAEALDIELPEISSGELREILKAYDDGLPEELDVDTPTWQSGTLDLILIQYEHWPSEGVEPSHPTFTSGTMP